MKPDYEGAKKEAIFIALPLLVLFIVKLMSNSLIDFMYLSDFSLASSIMYGQLLAKTLDVPDKSKKSGRFSSFQVYIFIFAMLSMTMYISFQTISDVEYWLYIAQIVMFVIGLFLYIPLSSAVNKMNNL